MPPRKYFFMRSESASSRPERHFASSVESRARRLLVDAVESFRGAVIAELDVHPF